jgi:hypothetical protein
VDLLDELVFALLHRCKEKNVQREMNDIVYDIHLLRNLEDVR